MNQLMADSSALWVPGLRSLLPSHQQPRDRAYSSFFEQILIGSVVCASIQSISSAAVSLTQCGAAMCNNMVHFTYQKMPQSKPQLLLIDHVVFRYYATLIFFPHFFFLAPVWGTRIWSRRCYPACRRWCQCCSVFWVLLCERDCIGFRG